MASGKRIHLLSLSLDQNLLDPKMGDVLARQQEYAKHFDHTTIIVMNHSSHLTPRTYEKLDIIPVNAWSKCDLMTRAYLLASKIGKKNPFHLITAQDPLATGLVGVWFKSKLKIPLNVQVHADLTASEKGLRKMLVSYCLKRADSIRVVSQKLKTNLINDLTIKRSHDQTIFVAPVRVNLDLFWKPAHYKPKITRFISVGRLAPEKNYPMLIESFQKVQKTHPEATLTIVGDGPEKARLTSDVNRLKAESSSDVGIEIVGPRTTPEVASLLHRHDAFLLTSNYEGWGMAYVEAFAAGLPIITTPVSSVGELLQPDTNCLIASDVSHLTSRISQLIDHPEEAYRLAKNGQMWVKNNLDAKVLTKAWIDGLHKTVETTKWEDIRKRK